MWPRPECDTNKVAVGTYCSSNDHFWTATACTLKAKISSEGKVAIVHSPNGVEMEAISGLVQNDTKTFFRVDWSSATAAA